MPVVKRAPKNEETSIVIAEPELSESRRRSNSTKSLHRHSAGGKSVVSSKRSENSNTSKLSKGSRAPSARSARSAATCNRNYSRKEKARKSKTIRKKSKMQANLDEEERMVLTGLENMGNNLEKEAKDLLKVKKAGAGGV